MAHVVTAGRHFGGAIVRLLDGRPGAGMRDQLERDVPGRSASEWWATLEQDRAALFAPRPSYSGSSAAHSGHVHRTPSACPGQTSTCCSFTASATRVTVHGVFRPNSMPIEFDVLHGVARSLPQGVVPPCYGPSATHYPGPEAPD
jgi:hypothetical protein